jgi:hypothetical protein
MFRVYNVSIMNVYLVKFKSTGEVWHSAVCANQNAVKSVLSTYAITEKVYESTGGEFAEFRNPNDVSQSATVSTHVLIER